MQEAIRRKQQELFIQEKIYLHKNQMKTKWEKKIKSTIKKEKYVPQEYYAICVGVKYIQRLQYKILLDKTKEVQPCCPFPFSVSFRKASHVKTSISGCLKCKMYSKRLH